MKKIFKAIKHTPILIVIIIVVLFFLPPAIASSAETTKKAIIVALGIDKNEDEFELSFLTFVPIANQNFVENYKVISSTGDSISKAIDLAGLNIGKEVTLSHTTTTIINENMLEEDVIKYIDYLKRTINLSNNTSFVCTNDSAKNLMIEIQKLSSGDGINIEDIIAKNRDYIYSLDNTLERFCRGYYGYEKSSVMTYVSLEGSDAPNGIDATPSDGGGPSGSSSGDLSSSSGGSPNQGMKKIVNDGKTLLIKNGKKVGELNREELKSVNLFTGNFKQGTIKIDDVNVGSFSHTDLTYLIYSQGSKIRTSFENGIPIVSVNLKIEAALEEILANDKKVEINSEISKISQEIKDLIEHKVKAKFASTLAILREKKTDILGIYSRFMRSNRKEFKNYLETLEDKEEYLDGILFRFSVKTTPG